MTTDSLINIGISDTEIDPNQLIRWVGDPTAGGISVFIGTTRNTELDLQVEHLEFEAYVPLCLKYFKELCDHVFEKYKVTKICIHHRIGIVRVGESSIMIAVSGSHRKDPINAVEYILNEIKANAAVWKKEIYSNSNSTFKVNSECTWGR